MIEDIEMFLTGFTSTSYKVILINAAKHSSYWIAVTNNSSSVLMSPSPSRKQSHTTCAQHPSPVSNNRA